MEIHKIFSGAYDNCVRSWRVMLDNGSCISCIKDNIPNEGKAKIECDLLSRDYGEGNYLFIEKYEVLNCEQ